MPLKYEQLCYLKDLIKKYGKSKGKHSIWKRLRKYFYYGELDNKLVVLVEEIYKKLNKHGRELLTVALKSKKHNTKYWSLLDG